MATTTEELLLHGSEWKRGRRRRRRQDVVPLSRPSACSLAARRPIEAEDLMKRKAADGKAAPASVKCSSAMSLLSSPSMDNTTPHPTPPTPATRKSVRGTTVGTCNHHHHHSCFCLLLRQGRRRFISDFLWSGSILKLRSKPLIDPHARISIDLIERLARDAKSEFICII